MIYIQLENETETIINCSYLFITTDKKQYSIYNDHKPMILLLIKSTIECYNEKNLLIKTFYNKDGIIHIENNTATSLSN